MELHLLSPSCGSVKEPKRKGRGPGSGNGKTGGRGHKGQKARSGGGVRPGFEGGQTTMMVRLPKRGFNNYRFATMYVGVNLYTLNERFENGETVDLVSLVERGIIKKSLDGIKILSNGKLEKKLIVRASAFSQSAREKIEAAGGTAEVV